MPLEVIIRTSAGMDQSQAHRDANITHQSGKDEVVHAKQENSTLVSPYSTPGFNSHLHFLIS